MKRICVERFGGPEQLRVVEAPVPVPGTGQAVVAVEFATVNPTDLGVRVGQSPVGTPRLPFTPGWDLTGTVSAVGDGVADLAAGDEVVGMIPWYEAEGKFGAYAEYTLVNAEWIIRRPPQLDPADAATLPLNAMTARQALDLLAAAAGATIFVTGASGAVGSFVVQMAKADGNRVIAQAGYDDEAWVESLGADEIIARHGDLASAGSADYMVDCVPLGDDALVALADGGRVVTVRATPEPSRGIERIIHLIRFDRDLLRQVIADGAAGRLRTRVSAVLPLQDASQAHRRAEAGRLHGKILLSPKLDRVPERACSS